MSPRISQQVLTGEFQVSHSSDTTIKCDEVHVQQTLGLNYKR